MFRPQIQKTYVVLLVAIFSIMMVYFALVNITYYETVGFQDKIESAEIMEEALSVLKKEVKKQYPDVPILEDIDPNLTGLIFNRPKSPMTTYSGDLKSKQTVLKPNFSALIVDLFLQAKLSKEDTIAIGMTGAMPGANIALLSACEAMEIVPVIITSVGASQWGATDSNFTWLDMEAVLHENNIISHRSIAASLGGRNDEYKEKKIAKIIYGGKRGAELASKAIKRNSITKIKGYSKRKSIYEDFMNGDISDYSAYVNIGGGVSSMGVGGNKLLDQKTGIIYSEEVIKKDLDKCVVSEFADAGVILINIHNIPRLIMDENGKQLIDLGGKEGKTGEGLLFYSERYTLWTTMLALFLTLGVVIAIGVNSFRQINEHMYSYETESIL